MEKRISEAEERREENMRRNGEVLASFPLSNHYKLLQDIRKQFIHTAYRKN